MNKVWRLQSALSAFVYSALTSLLLLPLTAAAFTFLSDTLKAAALCTVAFISLFVGSAVWLSRGWRESGDRLLGRSGFLTVSELSLVKGSVMGITQTVSPIHRLVGAVRFNIHGTSGASCSLLLSKAQAAELFMRLLCSVSPAHTYIRHNKKELYISDDMIEVHTKGFVMRSAAIPQKAICSLYRRQGIVKYIAKRWSIYAQTPAKNTPLFHFLTESDPEEICLAILSKGNNHASIKPDRERLFLIWYRRAILLLFCASFFHKLSDTIGMNRSTVLCFGSICCVIIAFSVVIGAVFAKNTGLDICADRIIVRTVRLFCFEERRILRSKLTSAHICASPFERALGVCSVSFYPNGMRRPITVRGLPADRARALLLGRWV